MNAREAREAIFEAPKMLHDSLCEAVSQYAPPCPECGGSLTATNIERKREFERNGDITENAFEVFRCENGHRIFRRLELDRYTRKQQGEEIEKALKRAERSRELSRGFGMSLVEMFRPGATQRAAEAEYPRRPEPDLMERYREQVTQ